MATALDSTVSVLHRSPYEDGPPHELVQITRRTVNEWEPSRFNARTIDEQGRMILWNSFTGAISVFDAAQVPLVTRLLSRKGVRAKEAGIVSYLYRRGFIVPKGTDEPRRLRFVASQQHYRTDRLELILLASEDCNLRCVYCYENFARGTMLPEVREGIKNYVRASVPRLRHLAVSWFGGEPLYGWDAIQDLAPFFLATAREHKLSYVGHMTTNGYLLTPDVADKLLAWEVRDFQITLDGTRDQHNAKRIGRDGTKTFDGIFSNLLSLKQRDDQFKVTIRHNFDRDNLPHIEGFLTLLANAFAGDDRFRVALHAIGRWGGRNDAAIHVCGAELKDDLVRAQLNAYGKGLKVWRAGVQDIDGPGTQMCYASRPYNWVIGADGKVMKCTVALDREDFNIVGHITPHGYLDADPDKVARWTDLAFERDPMCQSCYLAAPCQGMSCPLKRVRSGERYCIPTKSNLRAQLLQTEEMSAGKERTVAVR